jgi:hypothetical protein
MQKVLKKCTHDYGVEKKIKIKSSKTQFFYKNQD